MSAVPNRSGILAAGNWIVDNIKVIDVWPSQDALAIIQEETHANGGSPFNVLIDLAKLGATFPLQGAGIVGSDAAGNWILEACRQNHIDVGSLHRTDAAPTSYTDVMTVASNGRRTFFHQRGANALLEGSQIQLESSSAKIFHLGYLLLLDRLDGACPKFGTKAAELFHRASELGFITSVDLVSEESDRYRRIVLPALPYVDLLFMNEFEAEQLIGKNIRSKNEILPEPLEFAAKTFIDAGVRQWAIIHFPEGVLAVSPTGQKVYQGSLVLPSERIKGVTGAGDALTAGVLLGYHNDLPMERCLVCGVCAGAACIQHPSASDGMVQLEKCLGLSAEFRFREGF
jgi:sugar/nucleoside kinase (ribokinase family)